MGRKPCCDKVGLKRGPWDTQEDLKLVNFMLHNSNQSWRLVPKLAGLKRCGKSCRLRWINYLRPDLKRGDFSEEEEDQIIQLQSSLGNKWSKIASHFPGRTDNEIKNHWNCKIKKKLKRIGLGSTQKMIKHEEGSAKSTSCDQEQLVMPKLGPQKVHNSPNSGSKENDMIVTCGSSNVNHINGCDELDLSLSSSSSSSSSSPLTSTVFQSDDQYYSSIMSSSNAIPRGIFDDYYCLFGRNFQQYYWRESRMEMESLLSLEGFDKLEDVISLVDN